MEKVSGVLWRGRGNYLSTITVSNSRHPSSSPPSHSRFRSVASFCSRFPEELQRRSVVLVSQAQTLKCQLKTWAAFQKAPFPLTRRPSRPIYTCQERIWENLGKEAQGKCKQAGELSEQPSRAFNDKLYLRHKVNALTWRGIAGSPNESRSEVESLCMTFGVMLKSIAHLWYKKIRGYNFPSRERDNPAGGWIRHFTLGTKGRPITGANEEVILARMEQYATPSGLLCAWVIWLYGREVILDGD